MADTAELQRLNRLFPQIPLVTAMQVHALDYDQERLRLGAPLDANVNDKGSAFGGSLAAVMTLSGWGLVTLQLQAHGLEADVFVADSQIRYLSPLYTDLVAEATLAPGQDWAPFLATFRQRGRARAQVTARVALPDGRAAVEMSGRYVAKRRR